MDRMIVFGIENRDLACDDKEYRHYDRVYYQVPGKIITSCHCIEDIEYNVDDRGEDYELRVCCRECRLQAVEYREQCHGYQYCGQI